MSGNLPCAAALFADLHWQLHCRDGFGTALFYFQSINQSSSKFTVDVHVIIVELRFISSVV